VTWVWVSAARPSRHGTGVARSRTWPKPWPAMASSGRRTWLITCENWSLACQSS